MSSGISQLDTFRSVTSGSTRGRPRYSPIAVDGVVFLGL